jgi:lipopolysaccharide export system permease protein
MRAAGLSLARIAWGVAKTGLLLALAATLFGEFLAPASGQYAEERRALAQTNGIALQTEHGFWARDGSRFVHIQDVLPGHQLLGVTIYVFDDSQVLRQAMHAQRGDFRGEKWVLEDVQESLVSETRVAVRRHPRVTWQTLLKPELLAAAALKPDNLSAFALRRYIDYLAANRLQTNHYELAFWGKVLQPLATGVMVFVAVPFVFGPLRSVGGGARLLAGAALGFGFYLCSEIAGHVSLVYGTPAFVAALGPILLFGLSGYWLLRRTV